MGMLIEIFIGEDSVCYIDTISKLRIEIFKEYPYLYEGEYEYEKQYVKGYTTDKKAMIAVAKLDDKIIGVSTGIPLISESEIVAEAKNIFAKNRVNVDDFYYYGEVIVLPEFRGKGIASKLYAEQDKLIKTWGFKHVCILTVIREDDHPLKPSGYKSPDRLWEHLGFFRSNLTTEYHWPTIQADSTIKDVKNALEFWTKDLNLEDLSISNEAKHSDILPLVNFNSI